MRATCGVGALLGVASLAWSAMAGADIQNDVAALLRRWKPNKPYHLGPRVLEQGDELPLLLPSILARSSSTSCVHVVAARRTIDTIRNEFAIGGRSPRGRYSAESCGTC